MAGKSIRGMIRTFDIQGQDIDGVPFTGVGEQVLNYNFDPATGNGDLHNREFGTVAYGDLEGSLNGSASGTSTGFLWTGSFIYPRCTGDFAGWHWRGTWSEVAGTPITQWDAVFQIPDGGNKAAAVEANTWSAVKALYQ